MQTNGLCLSWTLSMCSTLCQTVKAGWESSHWDASLHSLRRYQNAASKLWPPGVGGKFLQTPLEMMEFYVIHEFNSIDFRNVMSCYLLNQKITRIGVAFRTLLIFWSKNLFQNKFSASPRARTWCFQLRLQCYMPTNQWRNIPPSPKKWRNADLASPGLPLRRTKSKASAPKKCHRSFDMKLGKNVE